MDTLKTQILQFNLQNNCHRQQQHKDCTNKSLKAQQNSFLHKQYDCEHNEGTQSSSQHCKWHVANSSITHVFLISLSQCWHF